MPDQKYIDPIHRPRERRDSTARANGLDTTANQPAPPTATLDPFEWASPRWDQDDTTVARPDVPEDLRGDTDKSVALLEMLPRPWQLPAIIPDAVIDPQTGRKVSMPPDVAAYTRPDGARQFIDQWQGVRNLYFAINCLRPGMTTKADKSEIDEIVMLHVDVDPPKRKDIDLAMEQAHILDRLKGYHPPPSIIIGSGGGYWGLWLLREPVPVRDAAHADELALYNLALAEALGGDTKARDISRIARLPGTINLPNAEKRKAGRVPALATFEFYPDRVPTSPQHRHRRLVSASAAPAAPTAPASSATGDEDDDLAWLDDDPRLKAIIRLGRDPDNPRQWPRDDGGDHDANRAVLFVAGAMVRRFCGDEQIENVLLNPGYGISDHCLRQDNSLRAAQRAIAETRRTERAGAAHGRSGWQERRRDDGHDKQQERHDDTRHQETMTTSRSAR